MTNEADRWVVARDNGWAVTNEPRTLAGRVYELQVEAIMAAENEIADLGGGTLVICDRDDVVRQRTAVRGKPSAR